MQHCSFKTKPIGSNRGFDMTDRQNVDLLHGVTLKMMLLELEQHYGWSVMGQKLEIRCFTHDPSIASSLKFLRKTVWARDKVEEMYLRMKLGAE
jgi:uncharacterized protein (DUF2132 family)